MFPTSWRPKKGEQQIRAPILYYHRVQEGLPPSKGVAPPSFAAQMAVLQRKGYRTISFEDLADFFLAGKPLPRRPLIISFDDGYLDNFTCAYPILKQFGFHATFFLVSGLIGGRSEWEGCRGEDVAPLMSGEQIRMLQGEGFHFGCHTQSHRKLISLPEAEARREVEEGKKKLEDLLQAPVRSFAYPFGDFDDQVLEMIRDAGFVAARTVHTDNTHRREDLLKLRCVKVNGNLPMYKFKYYLTGLYHLETKWQERRRAREKEKKK